MTRNLRNTRAMLAPMVLAAGLAGCDDLLIEEPKTFLTTETYYRNADELETGLMAAYNRVDAVFRAAHSRWWGSMGLASDQENSHPTEVNQGTFNPAFLRWTAESPGAAATGWEHFYRMIYILNLLDGKLDAADMTEAQRTALRAEIRFLRGYAYMHLDKRYSAGPQPSDLSVPLFVQDVEHFELRPRATVAEVHQQILDDLTAAEAGLATASQRGTSGRGRATKGAAQMALAEFHQWRSSYMGLNEWQQMSNWAKKVIDSGEYGLVESGWFNIWNPSAKGSNDEMIWMIVATGIQGRQTSQFVNLHGPRDLGFGTGGGYGVNRAQPSFVASFAPGDIRGTIGQSFPVGMFEADTFAYRDGACSSTTNFPGSTPVEGVGYCGLLPFNSIYPYKFRARNLIANQGDVDTPLYRLGEAYLMYAEAQNEMGNTAEAIGAVNVIRARARLGASGTEDRPEPADLPLNMSQAEAREAIYQERGFELAHENRRWLDMIRRDSQEPGYFVASYAKNRDAGEQSPFDYFPDLDQRPYLKRLPVPAREIDLNPNLQQNPGW